MKVEIIYKPQLQENNEKVRNIHTYTGITATDLEFSNDVLFLTLRTYLCISDYVRVDDSIEMIHITDFAKGKDRYESDN